MNVVIVDDDEAFLKSTQILLSRLGHRVLTFTHAGAVCVFMETWGMWAQVDVLILDYMLGERTALDVLRRVRPVLSSTCKVVLISGHTDLVEPLDLKSLGVWTFLPKPLNFERLLQLAAGQRPPQDR